MHPIITANPAECNKTYSTSCLFNFYPLLILREKPPPRNTKIMEVKWFHLAEASPFASLTLIFFLISCSKCNRRILATFLFYTLQTLLYSLLLNKLLTLSLLNDDTQKWISVCIVLFLYSFFFQPYIFHFFLIPLSTHFCRLLLVPVVSTSPPLNRKLTQLSIETIG